MLAAQQPGNLFADAGKAVVASIGLVDLFPLVGTESLVERVGSRQVFAQGLFECHLIQARGQSVGCCITDRGRAWRGRGWIDHEAWRLALGFFLDLAQIIVRSEQQRDEQQ